MKTNNVTENLLNREFKEHGSRKVLLTNMIGKFCYILTVLDSYTKQILSYVLSDSLEVDFILETVNKLVKNNGIELSTETLIHNNQGCHYTSTSFI